MKSAFAPSETHTYTYPEPLDSREDNPLSAFNAGNIDEEVLGEITKWEKEAAAARKAGEPIPASPAPTVTLRIPRSKGDRDGIADATQSIVGIGTNGDGATYKARIAQGNRAVFELLCEDWWLADREGARPSAENFSRLDGWAANWITACIVNAQMRAEPDFREKPEPTSSSKPSAGQRGSAKASESA